MSDTVARACMNPAVLVALVWLVFALLLRGDPDDCRCDECGEVREADRLACEIEEWHRVIREAQR